MATAKATVNVTLLSTDGKVPHVYNKISGCFDSGKEVVLFDKSEEDNITMDIGQDIPLTKSEVGIVPLNAVNFKVTANLLNDNGSNSASTEIANGSATFPVKTSGRDCKRIEGRNGSVDVVVGWGSATV